MMKDLQDAVMEASAEIAEVFREVTQEIVLDMAQTQAARMWATMPDELKEQFKAERPEQYAALMKGLQNAGR